MTLLEENYGRVLYQLGIPHTCVTGAVELLIGNPCVMEALCSPVVTHEEKQAVIDRLFDKELCNYLKVVSDNGHLECFMNIVQAYEECRMEDEGTIEAELAYVTVPGEEQLKGIRQMICRKYNKSQVRLKLKEDSSLLGGFILTVGDYVYDRSLKNSVLQLKKRIVWR